MTAAMISDGVFPETKCGQSTFHRAERRRSRWLGPNEVFVLSFPVAGNKKRISTSGGVLPMWRSDGRELYFMTSDRTLMAVSVTTNPNAVESSVPVRLFQLTGVYGEENFGFGRSPYAPSADGQRFLLLVPVEDDRPQGLHLIHHWKP